MALPPVLNSIVTWLRAGYPEGVPDVDYLPLFALLGSELTDADVKAIVDGAGEYLHPGDGPAHQGRDHQRERRQQAVGRGRGPGPARLAGGGWPLAKPHHL